MKSSYAFSPGNPSLANSSTGSTSQGKQRVLATIDGIPFFAFATRLYDDLGQS